MTNATASKKAYTYREGYSVGFKVATPNYSGTVIISFQDNSFYCVSFRDLEFKILGITGEEKVLDAVKDFVENGEVWV